MKSLSLDLHLKPWAFGRQNQCEEIGPRSGHTDFPGTEDAVEDVDEAVAVAQEIGFPVIVKAAAGGGGRGMRIVREASEPRCD